MPLIFVTYTASAAAAATAVAIPTTVETWTAVNDVASKKLTPCVNSAAARYALNAMFTPMIAVVITPMAVPIPTIRYVFLDAKFARSVKKPMNFVATGSRAVPMDSFSSSIAMPNFLN